MKIILFFQSTTRKSWFQKLSGIHRFAQEHDWFVQVVERYSTATDIRRALKNWAPAGCLVDRAMSNGRAPDAFFRGIPTVYLDQNPGKPSAEHPCLLHDSAASASLAAQELFANDCQSYAYFGMEKDVHWDKARLERFRQEVAATGRPFEILHRDSLENTLKSLPKPCGALCANDYCAMEVWYSAVKAGLCIPNDVLITGIDNDENYCEAISLGLTSVEPDFEGAGWHLGEMLERELSGKGGVRQESYGPLRLVRRGSTILAKGVSPVVRKGIEYIRRHAFEPSISVDAVASAMGCSRSLATSRFRKETGLTILDEIHNRRFERMRELLAHTSTPIALVVERCGYESNGFAKKFFLKQTGMTMREYRKNNSTTISGKEN